MRCVHAVFLALLAAASPAQQLHIDRTVVAVRMTGPGPATQLLAIDAQGAVTPLGRFPSDVLAPLAIEFDAMDGHLLLALDLSGTSSVVRLVTSGLTVQGVGSANREQIEKVFYRAFVFMLAPSANFSQARAATIQAALDLYGSGAVANAVTQAWNAVGVN